MVSHVFPSGDIVDLAFRREDFGSVEHGEAMSGSQSMQIRVPDH